MTNTKVCLSYQKLKKIYIERTCTIPEGVEVKISAELVKPLVVDKWVVKTIIGNKSRYVNNAPERYVDFSLSISPVKIVDVNTKGKFMYWTFDNGWYMFSTFGMTGQYSPNKGKHMCFHFCLIDPNTKECSNIYFNDPRHFGTIKFTNSEKELKDKLNELGWDPLKSGLTENWSNWIYNKLSTVSKPIGQVLLDQSIFAGVGNYIRAEALYNAKISPWRLCKLFTKNDVEILCQSIVEVMKESYDHQGATLLTYKDAYGNEGKYSSCFKVYGRDKDPLGNIIKSEISPEGRTIHWCPNIQA